MTNNFVNQARISAYILAWMDCGNLGIMKTLIWSYGGEAICCTTLKLIVKANEFHLVVKYHRYFPLLGDTHSSYLEDIVGSL